MDEEEQKTNEKHFLGFWVYLMTDLLMFAGLFAAFSVLRGSTFGGVSGKDIFNMPYVLLETLFLLTSSFTCGLCILFAQSQKIKGVIAMLLLTFALGASFLGMELYEFHHLFVEGHTPSKSAFLSSYFTLVGTHGLHISVGLLWMAILFVTIARKGLTKGSVRKLTIMSLFWHFLDIVWIFIFTIVYLMGVL
jgi:cytochrome o ubiquinol oxidase subunit 3